ncbi:MAG: hypothetical protein OXU61_04175 [Gammaproteobacteria bacterium]|nr:hypothetical protein [Gammaproteobacteria bacterium]
MGNFFGRLWIFGVLNTACCAGMTRDEIEEVIKRKAKKFASYRIPDGCYMDPAPSRKPDDCGMSP